MFSIQKYVLQMLVINFWDQQLRQFSTFFEADFLNVIKKYIQNCCGTILFDLDEI